MSLKSLFDDGQTIYRVLAESGDSLVVIDCLKRTMPMWIPKNRLFELQQIEEQVLHEKTGVYPVSDEELSRNAVALAHKRYSMIAPAVAVVADKKQRNDMINLISRENRISKQTVRKYLCLYLAFQTITVLAPIDSIQELILSERTSVILSI